jgi:hypothetical protein
LDKNKIIKIYLFTVIPELWYKKVGGSDETNNAHNPIGFIIDTNSNQNMQLLLGKKIKFKKAGWIGKTKSKQTSKDLLDSIQTHFFAKVSKAS